jgi:hypothetical protein
VDAGPARLRTRRLVSVDATPFLREETVTDKRRKGESRKAMASSASDTDSREMVKQFDATRDWTRDEQHRLVWQEKDRQYERNNCIKIITHQYDEGEYTDSALMVNDGNVLAREAICSTGHDDLIYVSQSDRSSTVIETIDESGI